MLQNIKGSPLKKKTNENHSNSPLFLMENNVFNKTKDRSQPLCSYIELKKSTKETTTQTTALRSKVQNISPKMIICGISSKYWLGPFSFLNGPLSLLFLKTINNTV